MSTEQIKTTNCICVCHCGAEKEKISKAIHEIMKEFASQMSNFDILQIPPNKPKKAIDTFKLGKKAVKAKNLKTTEEKAQAKPYWAVQATIDRLKIISQIYPFSILLVSRQVQQEIEKAGLSQYFTVIKSIFIPDSENIAECLKNIFEQTQKV